MNTVLIVDDEPIIREGIKNKIEWEALGLKLSAEAEDGIDALACLEQELPTIMLTDIRMPELDGLQLVQEAKRKWPDLICVIVSGYHDFEYARQAIKYGVQDYVLKPVNDKELNRLLGELLERHKEQADEKNDLQLTRLIGQTGSRPDGERLPGLPIEEGYAVVFEVAGEIGQPQWKRLRQLIEKQLLGAKLTGHVFRHAYHPQEMVVLVSSCSASAAGMSASYNGRKLWVSRTMEEIRLALQAEVTAGMGMPVKADNMAESYKAALLAVKSKIVHGSGRIFEIESGQYSPLLSPLNSEEERYLSSVLEHGQRAQLREMLVQRFSKLAANPECGLLQLEKAYAEIEYFFQKCCSGYTHTFLARGPAIETFNSWHDAVEDLLAQGDIIMKAGRERQQRSGEEIVSEVKQFIDQHYYENISLNWVADRYYIHAKYFSKLFKEKYGENFSDYITKVRLEHAAERMADGSLSIQQVAALVGYEDAAYFSSVFRKYYGMTPTQFRESLRA
ncbi:response regulator [Paenibacillus sp. GCM10027626]|uniref:response regulator transcription factor n=1 Tax=Paenibacillus sp. GCM10027626 TaxID=3273411 RepID=UPI00362EE92B